MALFQVELPGGSVYQIEAADNTPEQHLVFLAKRQEREQHIAELQQRVADARNRPAPVERTAGKYAWESAKGFIPGAIGFAESAGAGLAALLPEEAEKTARDKLKEIAGIAKKPFEAAPGYEDIVGRKVMEGLGSLGVMAPLGLLGAPGVAAGVGLGLASGAGEARERAEAEGASSGQRGTATALGTIPGGFDAAIDMALAAFPGGAGKALGWIRRALVSGGVEGATEAAQAIAQNAIAKGVYKPDQSLIEGSGEEGAYGAGVGALASVLLDLAIPGRRGGAAAPAAKPADEAPKASGTPLLPYNPGEAGPVAALPNNPTAPQAPGGAAAEVPTEAAAAAPSGPVTPEEPPAEAPVPPTGPEEPPVAPAGPEAPVPQTPAPEAEPEVAPEVASEAQPAEAPKAEQTPIAPGTTFVTAKGSSYVVHEDGTTTRNKAARNDPGHEGDSGVKERSAKTVYLTEQDLHRVNPLGLSSDVEWRIVDHGDGTVSFATKRPDGRWGIAPNSKNVPVQTAPAEGLHPLELWKPGKIYGKDAYKGAHPGNKIVRMQVVQPEAPAKPVAETQAPEPTPQAAPEPTPQAAPQLTQAQAPQAVAGPTPQVAPEPVQNIPTATPEPVTNEARTAERPNVGDDVGAVGISNEGAAPSQPAQPRVRADSGARQAEAPETAGLGDRGRLPSDAGSGAPKQPRAVKPEAKPEAKAEKKLNPEAHARKLYKDYADTARGNNPEGSTALHWLAHDVVDRLHPRKQKPEEVNEGINKINEALRAGKMPQFKFGRAESTSGFPGLGGANAQRYYDSLTPEEHKVVFDYVKKYYGEWAHRIDRAMAMHNTRQMAERENRAQMDEWIEDESTYQKELATKSRKERRARMQPKNLPIDEVFALAPIHPGVEALLKSGDLKGALDFLAERDMGRVSKVAAKLAESLGDTKVEVVRGLKDDGRAVAGLFDPKTNTIKLDAKALSTHSLLHEAVHAATSHVLDNKSHPMTKQLTQLFESVRGSLDTMYGAMSLDEFVAEAFSNPEFQEKLASITPDGKPVTALQRFLSAVGNFVRKMLGMNTKPAGSALDSADAMIDRILSPAPDARSGEQLMLFSTLGKGKEVLDSLGKRATELPEIDQEWKDRVHYFFTGRAPGAMKEAVRATMTLRTLCEVAKKYLPMAPKLDALIQERSGTENTRNQAVEQTVAHVERWKAKATDKQLTALFKTAAKSTLEEVDPTQPLERYSKYWATVTTTDPNNPGKEVRRRVSFDTNAERTEYIKRTNDRQPNAKAKAASSPDKDKIETWKALQQGLKDMGPDGVAVYKIIRDSYTKMHDEVIRLFGDRIDNMVQDKEVAKSVKRQLMERLINSGRIDPYFSLQRKGDFWLAYNVGGEHYIEAFEYPAARERAIEQLKRMQKAGEPVTDIQSYHKRKGYDFRKAPSASFVHGILRTLETNKVNPDVTGKVMEAFLDMLPETSFAQSYRKREGTLGFEKDVIKVFRSKAYSLSRQITNMEYGAKLEKLRIEIIDEAKKRGDTETNKYADELEKRINLALNPGVAPWSKVATSIGFNMTLGLNVSSALINMSQIPLVTVPYLGGKYGLRETGRALGRATKMIHRGGTSREIETLVPFGPDAKIKIKAMPSIDNIDFDKKENEDIAHIGALVKLARERGQLNRSMIHDTLDMGGDHGLMTKVNAITGFTFHLAERMNREMSLVTAYELELQRLVGKDGKLKNATAEQKQRAAEYAIEVTELTNGGTAAAAAPRISQNSLGKVLFMYKRYGVSMYEMLFKTANEAFFMKKPEGMSDAEFAEMRATAKRQLAGIYASSALMAGAQGIPMFGIVSMLYNLFLKGDDDDDFDTAARKWMGELFYSGLGNGVLGVELASRMGLSDLLFRDTSIKPSDSVMAALAEQMGGPVFGVASRVERGLKLISEGHTERGIEQMLPSALGNAFKAVRFGTEGAQTLRGDPIVGEIGAGNVFAQFFGFAPAEYTRQLAINSSIKNIERSALEKKQDLLRKYFVASRVGDGAEMSELMSEMMDYSVKHPTDFITPDTIERSMAQHARTSMEMYHGVTLNKKLRSELLESAAEFDD